ncbi:hypothetical protein DSCO28_16440 [Desulfosarcina ovata subsp. sediminis]|uniref:DUF1329 domain-containing protein n=1 Tax=Desulfosarcina ovata subsp. sediminis TaxID=885957 RepID=A0A5K7ZFX9_9BACT|nr:DUF1329 domain-containing protein [Desulfosarcina ovata]BBO81078.1 hypothetical protein DSCO28_16440 [Desulfosarcina ovata subsp. sediminis]
MKLKLMVALFSLLFSYSLLTQSVLAKVSAQEAEKLKTVLTPVGAEKAGNADGTIPPWDGGYTTVPPGYKSGDLRPDPFADEKPLYTITADNMVQYAEQLSDGVQALLKKYKDFRMDVYPTHRTFAAPQFIYEATFKNATTAELRDDNEVVDGAYHGIPFPIPKDGYEAIWNHILAWRGVALFTKFRNYIITRNSKVVLTAEAEQNEQFPYYQKDVPEDQWNRKFWYFRQVQTAPPFKAGETLLTHDDMGVNGRQSWQYLVGQRRVRRAPSIAYDTPDFVNSGHNFFDEVFVFNGRLDRYKFTLVGKKEVYIPYNCNGFLAHKDKEVLGSHFVNPNYVRWELHRVWVVQADLKPGKRHAVTKRIFYLDEDAWRAIMADGWDGKGQLWRSIISIPIIAMEFPAVLNSTQAVYNLQSGAYGVNIIFNETHPQIQAVKPRPDSFFSPESLAATGVR